MTTTRLAAAVLALGLAAAPAPADQLGAAEFDTSCAACHGTDAAAGDAPLAGLLTVPVPDLTTLAARNDGRFPMLEVMQIIDGRSGVRGHGGPMPVWGDRYAIEMGQDVGNVAREIEVRGRVLSLALYLQSIQR